MSFRYVRRFRDIDEEDVDLVGGKNASLGELLQHSDELGIRVPDGFALTTLAYRHFLAANGLEEPIENHLKDLKEGFTRLSDTARSIRRRILGADMPLAVSREVRYAYRDLSEQYRMVEADVAVRSSAAGEDSREASFAGQQDSFLDVEGADIVLQACRECYASLFTDRALSYRRSRGLDDREAAMSVGVQKMVRAETGSAGVAFSVDTETGCPETAMITAAPGLGEDVVQGRVTPDQYTVHKDLLDRDGAVPIVDRRRGDRTGSEGRGGDSAGAAAATSLDASGDGRSGALGREESRAAAGPAWVLQDADVLEIARAVRSIEEHFGLPVDVEWAKDGETGEISIVQARPETVQSRSSGASLESYSLTERSDMLASGLSVGQGIATGTVRRVSSPEQADDVGEGDILVTEMTDPDWVPIMERVAGIVTDRGGRTCHAAIVSRELGIPALVGTGDATQRLESGRDVTLSCAEGDEGGVYDGKLEYESEEIELDDLPETSTSMMLNLGSPSAAFRWWRLPSDGVGLARVEFIISNRIKIHPMALLRPEAVDSDTRERIRELTRGYEDPADYFVDHLAWGIARIASAHHPSQVIVRLSDFKTNEYADLLGGRHFEEPESNPMLGFRGAIRYYSERYREAFALECRAIRRVREHIGLDNVTVMVPFCRTLEEADCILEELADNGLRRGQDGLEVYMMCEVPSNVVLADEFAERFDGFSIGSNDLTQLTLGVDRDSSEMAPLFDERDEAVTRTIRRFVEAAQQKGRKVGICGQAPSDHPAFAEMLVEAGIDSISLSPDSFAETKRIVARAEAERGAETAEFPRRARRLQAPRSPGRRTASG